MLDIVVLEAIVILTGVAILVPQRLEKVVESRGEEGAEDRAEEVDPEVPGERSVGDGRAKRARRVE